MVEQKITTKFITQFCFQLNKKTYALIVDYLRRHKDLKGEGQISYDDIWPEVIKDVDLRTEIENIPTKILRSLNKDISEAYHLLMESFSDKSLENLFRYQRIRDLYHFMTEIILKKIPQIKKERNEAKDDLKELPKKKAYTTIIKPIQKALQVSEDKSFSETEWNYIEERYLCALYLEKPLLKCCQKLRQKFGESQKWNTTKKVYKKAEEIFQKSLKKALRFSQLRSLKQTILRLQSTKQNLISQIIKKKSNKIQKFVLKFYKSLDSKKKSKNLQEINKEILILMVIPDGQKKRATKEEVSEESQQKIKEEVRQQKPTKNQSIEIDKVDSSEVEGKLTKVKIQLGGSNEFQSKNSEGEEKRKAYQN